MESDGEVCAFQREMQMLKWLCEKHSQLMPDINRETIMVKEELQ